MNSLNILSFLLLLSLSSLISAQQYVPLTYCNSGFTNSGFECVYQGDTFLNNTLYGYGDTFAYFFDLRGLNYDKSDGLEVSLISITDGSMSVYLQQGGYPTSYTYDSMMNLSCSEYSVCTGSNSTGVCNPAQDYWYIQVTNTAFTSVTYSLQITISDGAGIDGGCIFGNGWNYLIFVYIFAPIFFACCVGSIICCVVYRRRRNGAYLVRNYEYTNANQVPQTNVQVYNSPPQPSYTGYISVNNTYQDPPPYNPSIQYQPPQYQQQPQYQQPQYQHQPQYQQQQPQFNHTSPINQGPPPPYK